MKSTQFDPRLEAIRGLAALMVAGTHALVVFPTTGLAAISTSVLRTFLNGDAAVPMFFVLSGLVLGMGLQRQGKGSLREYFSYALRRVFRIYPMLLLSTGGILLFLVLARKFGGPDFWFNQVLGYRLLILNSDAIPVAAVIISNLLLVSASLNLVTWTLGVEMVSSLLLPWAHYARVRMPASGKWLLLAAAGVLAFLGKWFLLFGWVKFEGAFNWDLFQSFYLFYAGYLLPVLGPGLFARVKSSKNGTGLLLGMALGLHLLANRFSDTYGIGAGLGAWLVLGALLYGHELRAFRFLDWPLVRFFGRISYSFYLLHDLVLITCGRLGAHYIFPGRAPAHPFLANWILMGVSILITAGVAWAAHRWIELPFIQAGKRLAAKVATWRGPRFRTQPVPTASQNIPA